MKNDDEDDEHLSYRGGAPGYVSHIDTSKQAARKIANRRPRQELILLDAYARTLTPCSSNSQQFLSDWEAQKVPGLQNANIPARRARLVMQGFVELKDRDEFPPRKNPDTNQPGRVYGLTRKAIRLLKGGGLEALLATCEASLKKGGEPL